MIGLPAYFVWEMLQMPAFTATGSWLTRTAICALATLGDGVMLLGLWALGVAIYRESRWFVPARLGRYAGLGIAAVVMQVIVEWVAVDRLGLWSYASAQPRVPLIGTGIVPILQAMIVPPFVFAATAVRERAENEAGRA